MIIELTRFRVRPGAEARVAEWMEFLRSNPAAFRETLEPEQMYVETILSEVIDGVTYLYWYSVQGEDRRPVSESDHWLDAKHLEFWRECIDPDFAPQELTPQLHMTPERVETAMRPLGHGSLHRDETHLTGSASRAMCTPRPGSRPLTSDEGPHRQLDQCATPALWGELVARVFALDGVTEGHSQVSPASSRAVFLTDMREERDPRANLAPGRRLEPVHLHGVDDTSVHLVLPEERGQQLVDLGWAEPHQYTDHGTEFMVYAPRDETELAVIVGIVEEALAFARST